MRKEDFREIAKYLWDMNKECLDKTGYNISVKDIKEHLESDEFIEKFGKITIDEFVLFGILYATIF